MRAILLSALVAAGIGLAGTASVSAAPVNAPAIDQAANQNSNITKVQHWRWGSRRHWRRCHYRRWSRWGRC